MLNSKERQKILGWFRFFCIINLFPVRVDLQTGDIRSGCGSSWKFSACMVSYSVFAAHSVYKVLSLVHACRFFSTIPLHQMVLHVQYAAVAFNLPWWYYILYVKHAQVHAQVAKLTLRAEITGGAPRMLENTENKGKRWFDRLLECSLQDLIAIWLPHMLLLAASMAVICMIYDPTMKLLLYAALPESYQSWLTLGIGLVAEWCFLLFGAGLTVPAWQLQIVVIQDINEKLETLIESMMKTRTFTMPQRNTKTYRTLRRLQLYIKLVNIVNRPLIFSWKLLSIGMCIISGYAAIAHFGDHPIFGVLYYGMFFDIALFYTIPCEKAFKVPILFIEAKRLLRTQVTMQGNRMERKIFRGQVMSIRSEGIKVGEFHTLERTSTPVFLHYVLGNIVSMLVTFG